VADHPDTVIAKRRRPSAQIRQLLAIPESFTWQRIRSSFLILIARFAIL